MERFAKFFKFSKLKIKEIQIFGSFALLNTFEKKYSIIIFSPFNF